MRIAIYNFPPKWWALVLKYWNRSDKKFIKAFQWFLMGSLYVNKRMKPWFWAWILWKIFIDWLLEIEQISPSQTSFMFTFRFQWNHVGVDKKTRKHFKTTEHISALRTGRGCILLAAKCWQPAGWNAAWLGQRMRPREQMVSICRPCLVLLTPPGIRELEVKS